MCFFRWVSVWGCGDAKQITDQKRHSESELSSQYIACYRAGVDNLFTITGCINGGLLLAGRKNNRFNEKIEPLPNYEG